MYEDLDIQYLTPGGHVRGIYRGDKFHTVPDPEKGEIVLGRVFLETDEGPLAVGGEGGLLAQVKALDLQDGESLQGHGESMSPKSSGERRGQVREVDGPFRDHPGADVAGVEPFSRVVSAYRGREAC